MEVNRRTFLLAAGATAVTASCGTPPEPAPPTTLSAPVPPDWEALRARLGGALTLPADQNYAFAKASFNTFYDQRNPAAIAVASAPEHVQACIDLARRSAIPIAARSGGHSYAGYSAPDNGLVVDLRGMSDVTVQPDGITAVVGAGARLIDVYTKLAAANRCLPAGSCPSVGIAGLTLGGGIGVLSRKYGLTCDNLTAAQIVTADGTRRTVSANQDADLFWALRGGGGGNFGIVTSFTFATRPAPILTVFQLTFPPFAAPSVVDGWRGWIAQASNDLWANCVITSGTPPKARISGVYLGSPAAVNPLLDALATAIGTQPTTRTVTQRAYLDAMRFFAGCERGPCTPETRPRAAFVASSRILTEPVDPIAMVALLKGRTDLDILLDPMGGAAGEINPVDTAFPHRGAYAVAQIYQTAAPGGYDQAARSVAEIRTALTQLGAAGGYVNYIDPAMPDWAGAYYGTNITGLKDVARRYDPDRIFAHPQSIHSA